MTNLPKYREQYNHLSFISMVDDRTKDNHVKGLFMCDCGVEKVLPLTRVTHGKIKSCGHLRYDGSKNTTHGMRYTDEYIIWTGLKQRITNKNNKDFSRYGKRLGISDSIKNSFESFYKEVGPRPSKDYSIDRINNCLGYIEGNLRWATIKQQAENRARTIFVNDNNTKIMLSDYAAKIGVTYGAAYQRLKRGKLGVIKCI